MPLPQCTCTYMVSTYMFPLINTPTPEGMIISQPIFRFLGVIFDRDHDFEGPRSPKAHLDTVLRNLSSHLRRPRIWTHIGGAVQGLFASPVMLDESDRCVMGSRTCLLRSSRHSGLASAVSPRDGGERSLSALDQKRGGGGAFCGLFKVES